MKHSGRSVKSFFCLLVAAFLLVVFLGGCNTLLPPSASSGTITPSWEAPSVSRAPLPEWHTVKFSAVGDNLIHNGIYSQAKERAGGNGYDFSYAYEKVAYFFEQFDVNWINQETLVNNELEPSSYPCFSTPGPLGEAAYDAGWRVFALSNNHTYDKGAAGIAATRRFWETMPEDTITYGLYTDDADDSSIVLQQVNGITIAYLAYTEHTNGINPPAGAEAHVIYTDNLPAMEQQVRRARELADAVIVSVHWGVEDSHTITPAQRQLAGQYAAWGADVVIGTHPHVVQGVEWIQSEEDGRQVLVAYSLGNFLSAQAYARNMVGMVLAFDIQQKVEPDGTRGAIAIQNVKVYPTVTHYDAGYKNIHDYMFRDYTNELAARHGVNERNAFSLAYIVELMQNNIDPSFLVLD